MDAAAVAIVNEQMFYCKMTTNVLGMAASIGGKQ